MKVLGEDWFAVGDVYFRKLHLYDLPWGKDLVLSSFQISVCSFSGYIVMYHAGSPGSKPFLQIYTSSGKILAQQVWKDAPVLKVGWSIADELLVVQKSGFTTILNLQGKYLRRFSMGPEAEEREIIDAKFFTIDNNTGIAILTGGNHFYLTTSIDTPRMRRLAELPISSVAFSAWEIITCALEPNASLTSTNTFRGPWAFVGHKKCLYRADFGTVETIELSKIAKTSCTHIVSMSISANRQFVAIYLDTGELLISNIRLTELHSHIDLTERISIMLLDADDSSNRINHPQSMIWSTTSALVLKWNHLIALVGAQADIYESFYPDDLFLAQEVDGVRLLSSTSHCLIQRVPSALESLGRIGASCPATWLLSASQSLLSRTGRVTDYLLPIRHATQMVEAVSHCIEAASHATLDVACQKELLHAAHMGQILLSAMFVQPDNCAPPGKVRELADNAARVSQTLRLLNSLAVPFIGFALTWRQFQKLGPSRLFQRLIARHHYPIAVELIRIDHRHLWPASISPPDQASDSTGCTLTRLLAHWVCHGPMASSTVGQAAIAERIGALIKTLHSNTNPTDGSKSKEYVDTAGSIDFAKVASEALNAGREVWAEQILEYEPRARRQIPLLIKLARFQRALVRAVETGDPELISMVVDALQNQAKLPPADLAMALRKHPIALAIYQENWGQIDQMSQADVKNSTQAALLSFREENDRAAEAKKAFSNAFKETNLTSRLTLLQNAEDIYRHLKQDFMVQECNAAIRLLKFQSKLEKQEIRAPQFEAEPQGPNTDHPLLIVPHVAPPSIREKLWIGQPLNVTLGRLLASGQGERLADQLRREFRVSDKRFAYLRLVGMCVRNESWLEMDKMIRMKKPPVSTEILAKICIDGNRYEEAIKLIPRLPSIHRVRFWLLVGKIDEAIQAALREQSDDDLIRIMKFVGKSNSKLYDRVSALRQQLRNS